ncbi:MAG: hypothetical protein E7287_05070 [Lachnospiraceae bacterium]|nr:hypothetical protein [Lachnospiraceae bacterium]
MENVVCNGAIDVKRTICGYEQEITEKLKEINGIVAEMTRLIGDERVSEMVEEEPNCMRSNVEINFKNLCIIKENLLRLRDFF